MHRLVSLAAALSLLTGVTVAQVPYDKELLKNTDFESGKLTDWVRRSGNAIVTFYGNPSFPGGPSFQVAQAMAHPTWPRAKSGAQYYLRHTADGTTAYRQSFDLTGNSQDVDAGKVAIELAGYFGGEGGDPDYVGLYVIFEDAQKRVLGTDAIGNPSPTTRNGLTNLPALCGHGWDLRCPEDDEIHACRTSFRRDGSLLEQPARGCRQLERDSAHAKGARGDPEAEQPDCQPELREQEHQRPAVGRWAHQLRSLHSWSLWHLGLPAARLPRPHADAEAAGRQLPGSDNTADGTSTLQRRVDLRGNATETDQGQLEFVFDGLFGGQGSDPRLQLRAAPVLQRARRSDFGASICRRCRAPTAVARAFSCR